MLVDVLSSMDFINESICIMFDVISINFYYLDDIVWINDKCIMLC